MSSSPSALSDPARLDALSASGLMDADAEEAFDRFTRLATRLLGTPVALFSLVDDQRQFFKSALGLPDPGLRETPLSHSFCQYVVTREAPLAVDDALQDTVLATNGAVEDLSVRAYLGIPVRDDDGHVLGSFCVIDQEARTWTDSDQAVLEDLAAGVMTEMALREQLRERERDAAELRARQADFNALFENAGVGKTVVDARSGVILRANKTFANMLGYAHDEIVGRPFAEFTHPDDREENVTSYERFIDEGGNEVYRLDKRYLTREGRVVWGHVTATTVRDTEGTPHRTFAVIEDVTERRMNEEAVRANARTLRSLIDNVVAFVGIVTPDGLLTEANQTALDAADLEPGDVLGMPFWETFWWSYDTEVQERLKAAIALAAEGEVVRYDERVRTQGGFIDIDFAIAPMRDEQGRVTGLVPSAIDITHRKHVEETLRRRNAEMERFTYSVSHDLKAPLATVHGFLGVLETHTENGAVEKAGATLGRIRAATTRMNRLIDDLLVLSRAGQAVAPSQPVDVERVVQSIQDDLGVRLEAAHARFRIRTGTPRVHADAGRLRQALENLVVNALKYGRGPEGIEVEFWGQVVEDEVQYVVADRGPGIAPEHHATIFDLFHRVEREGEEVEGTGIGLALVAKIMEVHGGRAFVESDLGDGARFFLAFPIAALAEEDALGTG